MKPIELSARGFQYNKTIAETFQDMRRMNPGNPMTELLARMKINVPAPPRHSEEAKTAAQRLRIMKRSQELSPKPRPKIFESVEEPIEFDMFDLLKKAKRVVSGEARMARLGKTDQASKNIREGWLRTLPKERQDFFRANQKEYLSDPSKPIEFGILSAVDDIMARVGSGKMKYRHDLLGLQGKLTKNPKFRTTQRPGVADRSVNSNLVDQMAWNESKRHGIQSTYNMPGRRGPSENPNFSTTSKPIQFDASILGPWQGSKGHESKIDQLEFPAGMSPAAALQLPLPLLMQFLNQRNMLQQVYSSSPTMLSARLDRLIEFASSSALGKMVSKLGQFAGSAAERVTPVEGYLGRFNAASQEAGNVAKKGSTSALGGLNKVSAARGWGGAAAPAAPSEAVSPFKSFIQRNVSPGVAPPAGKGLNVSPQGFPHGSRSPVVTPPAAGFRGPGASGAGIQSYIAGSHYPGGVNAPIGGTPPPVPANLAASSAAGVVPAAAAPGTQATQAQAAASAAGQAAGAQQAGGHGLQPAAGGKPVEPGWWDKLKAQNDWSKFSTKKKWAVGGGAALAGGAIGGYMMMPSQNQAMSARLDELIEFGLSFRPHVEKGGIPPVEKWPVPLQKLVRKGADKAHSVGSRMYDETYGDMMNEAAGRYKNSRLVHAKARIGGKLKEVGERYRWLGYQQWSARLDELIHFDSRPRNPMGQFSPEEGGGPDRNAIAMTYGQHPIASAVGTGVVGGIAGQAGASSIKSLIEKIKKAKAVAKK